MIEDADLVQVTLCARDQNYIRLFGVFAHPMFRRVLIALFNKARQTEQSLSRETVIPLVQLEECLLWLEDAKMVKRTQHYRTGNDIWSLTKMPKFILNQARWRLTTWATVGFDLPALPETGDAAGNKAKNI